MESTFSKFKSLGGHRYLNDGFIDLQVNGVMGYDYSSESFDFSDVRKIIYHLAKSGTTKHVPTIVTSPRNRITSNIRKIVHARKSDPLAHAGVVAIHVEGPFISPEDGPRGAHDPSFIRPPTIDEIHEWYEISEGLLKIITLAPEVQGAIECIERITAMGIIAAIGHTGADPSIIKEAVSAGARLSTHLGNGSHSHIPRLHNYIWEQLAEDSLYAGLITDGFHLPEAVVKVITRVKGLDRLVLVSDVALLSGYSPGLYKWGNLDVQVYDDGHLGLPGTPFLAGAAHLLDWNIAHFIKFTGTTLQSAVKLCTVNPMKLLKLETDTQSSVEFIFKPGCERLTILKTVLEDTVLYEA